MRRDIKIYGVESILYPSMLNAISNMQLPCGGSTVAEGIAVVNPGNIAQSIIKTHVDDILTVSEIAIERAISLYLSIEKTLAEGAGAAPLAAVLNNRELFHNKNVGLVLSGGNIDLRLLGEVTMRNLVREGRVVSLRIDVTDVPGTLARIATIIGESGGNILEVSHQRMFLDSPVKNTELDLVVETRDRDHMSEIIVQINNAGYQVQRLSHVITDEMY